MPESLHARMALSTDPLTFRGARRFTFEVAMRAGLGHGGVPFDPRRYVPPDLSRPEERGYGMYLIARLVDEVSLAARLDGETIVLVKQRWAASQAALREEGAR